MGLGKTALLFGALTATVLVLGKFLAPADYRAVPFLGSRPLIWMVAQLHLLFAAFVLGVPIFAVITEAIGVKTKDPRYDRLAHEFTRLLSLAFTITAVFGVGLFLCLFFLYPKFFKAMTHIFRPTYTFYVILIVGEVIYCYLYYYSWEALKEQKWLHVAIGILLNVWGTLLMFTADAWASFMMSPTGISESGMLQNLWKAIANPTWMPLNIHRLLGNIAFGGLVAGAYAAVKFLTATTDEERAHYDWMGYTGNFIGACAMIPLPFAGYYLAREVYAYNEQMGITMMGGIFSWLFIVQAVLIVVVFISVNYYFWIGMGRIEGGERFAKYQVWMLALLFVCAAIWMTPHNLPATASEQARMGGPFHPIAGIFGVMSAKNTAVNLIILTTFLSFLFYLRAGKIETAPWAKTAKRVQAAIIALAALFVIFIGIYGYSDIFGIWVKAGQPPPALERVKLSPYQVLAVLSAMISVTAIDMFLFRGARKTGEIRWGQMPARSQYVLILLAVTIVLLMGLMGYLRSGLRQNWHIYAILKDTHPGAYTPALGYAGFIIGITVLIFFSLIFMIFYLGEKKTVGRE